MRGWAENFMGWLWCNIVEFCLFFDIVSHAVRTLSIYAAALGFPRYRSSHPDPRKKTKSADMTSSFVCFLLGNKNSQMVPNQENMEGDQLNLVQRHRQAQQPLQPQTCVQEHCPGEIGLPPFSRPFWLDCLSQLPQQFGIVYPIDSFAFLKVVNEHNALWFTTFPADDTTLAFFRGGEEGFHGMNCRWVSGSKWWTQHWSWVRKRSRKLAGSASKMPSSPATWPSWCAFDQASNVVHPPSGNLRLAKFIMQNVL